MPALLALAQPAIARGLGTFTLPTVGGLRLAPLEARGLELIAGTQTYGALGVYARLLAPEDPTCAVP